MGTGTVDPFAPPITPIEVDGEVRVRHRGGQVQITTLFLIDDDVVTLRFSLAGTRRASLKDGRFIERGHKMRGMDLWYIDGDDLERLRATAAERNAVFAQRQKESRYGKK